MGVIVSICENDEEKEQRIISKKIENNLQKDRISSGNQIKLLLLGPGESGKSTVVKQMRILHAQGFDEMEIECMKEVIYSNIITNMNVLLEAMNHFDISLAGPGTLEDVNLIQNLICFHNETDPISVEVEEALYNLWVDNGVQEVYKRRNEYQLSDSTEYFMERLYCICRADYRPNLNDVLRARLKTTGIAEIDFFYASKEIRVFDVGGQRTERKKWIHAFDNCDAIIFVAAISEFDQVIAEDGITNRVIEALRLFDLISNGLCFNETSIILFLNKIDLFRKKVQAGALIKSCFPIYNGPEGNVAATEEFMREQFLSINANKNRPLFSHLTCATDTQQIALIVQNVMDTIISQNLESGGLR